METFINCLEGLSNTFETNRINLKSTIIGSTTHQSRFEYSRHFFQCNGEILINLKEKVGKIMQDKVSWHVLNVEVL
jgi:hypothetical protein